MTHTHTQIEKCKQLYIRAIVCLNIHAVCGLSLGGRLGFPVPGYRSPYHLAPKIYSHFLAPTRNVTTAYNETMSTEKEKPIHPICRFARISDCVCDAVLSVHGMDAA